jgi:hypothetical protein
MAEDKIDGKVAQVSTDKSKDVGMSDKKPTLKKIYETRRQGKDKSEIGTSENVEKIPTKPDVKKTGPSQIAKASKGQDLKLAAGGTYPEGVPPGMTKMRWDFDSTTGKYLTGKKKELQRQTLWNRYRTINKKRGGKMSSFGKKVIDLPKKESLKYGD